MAEEEKKDDAKKTSASKTKSAAKKPAAKKATAAKKETAEKPKKAPAKKAPAKKAPAKKAPAKKAPAKKAADTVTADEKPAEKKAPAKKAAAKKEPAKKEPAKKVAPKKEPAKKEPAKKEPAAKKAPAKKAPAKKADADAPAEKKTGRSRRSTKAEATTDDGKIVASAEVAVKKPRRTRGSKAEDEKETVEAAAPAEKKPARSRRSRSKDAEETSPAQADNEEKTPAKSTRGRRGKKADGDTEVVSEAKAEKTKKTEKTDKPEEKRERRDRGEKRGSDRRDRGDRGGRRRDKSEDVAADQTPRDLPKTMEDLETAAVAFLDGLFERMMLDIKASTKRDGNTLHADLVGPDCMQLLGRTQSSPKALEAVQSVARAALTEEGSTNFSIILDVGGFRQKRTDRLSSIAGKLADTAAKVGQTIVVAGMNSFERRVVHHALENNQQIKTESEGQGSFRKLRVEPR